MLYLFEPGTYIFEGSYFLADSMKPFSIEGRFTASGGFEESSIEGTCEKRDGGSKFPLKIEMTSSGLKGFLGARVVAHLGPLKLDGWIAGIAEGHSGVARDASGNCASIQVLRLKPKAHTAQGLLIWGADKAVSFALTIGPFDPEMALENVVSIRDGQRA